MPLPRFPRLQEIFGAQLDGLQESQLRAVIAGSSPVIEDADLDFKRDLYANNDEGKRALAQDVAAMANTRGGVILLGVDEANGAASALTSVPLSDAEELRIRQVVAGLVAPVPAIEMKRVPVGTPNSGVLILAVPPSAGAPHGVRVNDGLRYYRREGSRNRPLAEGEVADAYRSRFATAEAQVSRLARIHTEAVAQLDVGERVWMTLALVPNTPGTMSIEHRTLHAMRQWSDRFASVHLGDGPFRRPVVGVAVRRMTVRSSQDAGLARGVYAELFDDGSGFAAREIFSGWVNEQRSVRQLADEQLVLTMSGLITVLSAHAARNAGAYGDAVLRSGVHGNHHTANGFTPPLGLGHRRGWGDWEPSPGSRNLVLPVICDRTLNIQALATDNCERVLATRAMLTEHFQAFGLPEVPQISSAGELRVRYWREGAPVGWNGLIGVPESQAIMEEG